jgi:tetratricopeptide (TPR) repeat protein
VFKRAIELRASYANAHHRYALLLSSLGRFAESKAQADQAMRLNPASVVVQTMRGTIFYDAREYDAAIGDIVKSCGSVLIKRRPFEDDLVRS